MEYTIENSEESTESSSWSIEASVEQGYTFMGASGEVSLSGTYGQEISSTVSATLALSVA